MSDEEQAGGPSEPPDQEVLIEALAGAHRERDSRGIRVHPAFYDLDGDGRAEAHALALRSRAIEAALDPEGLSTTAHAVLARIWGAG